MQIDTFELKYVYMHISFEAQIILQQFYHQSCLFTLLNK